MSVLVTVQRFYCGSLPSEDHLKGYNESISVNEHVAVCVLDKHISVLFKNHGNS